MYYWESVGITWYVILPGLEEEEDEDSNLFKIQAEAQTEAERSTQDYMDALGIKESE